MEVEFDTIVDGVINPHFMVHEGDLNHESPEGERPNSFPCQLRSLAHTGRREHLPSVAVIHVKLLSVDPSLLEVSAGTIVGAPVFNLRRCVSNGHRIRRMGCEVEGLAAHSRRRLSLEAVPGWRIIGVPVIRQTRMWLVHGTRVRSCRHTY